MAQNRQSKTAISLDIYGKFHQFAAPTCIENPEDKTTMWNCFHRMAKFYKIMTTLLLT